MILEILGWIGSLLLAGCGIPQAIAVVKQKHANGISWSFLIMWYFGLILTMIYVMITAWSYPLIVSYAISILSISVILWYKLKPRRKLDETI